MRTVKLLALLVGLAPLVARGQDSSYRVEVLNEKPPQALAAPIRETLQDRGLRVLDADGKPLVDLWLRKAVPAASKPAGPKGSVLFPFLAEGELLGAMKWAAEGHDYRDQAIAPGVYTLRYQLQPVNGDHLGVSPYRDFGLLVAAAKDTQVEPKPRKELDTQSAEAAQSSHPAVFMMLQAPADAAAKDAPSLIHDQEKSTWGAVLRLNLAVVGAPAPVAQPIQLVVVGVAMM